MSNDRFKVQDLFTYTTSTHLISIYWTRIGNPSNPPLIFIHGTPWSSQVWHDLASSLNTRYCIYLYDHPGFGQSPQPRRLQESESKSDSEPDSDLDPSLVLRASASAALIQHWNLPRPPHIVAHDNAGLVSLRLTLEHNLPFASLCLIDVVAIGPFGSPFFKLVADNFPVFHALPGRFLEGFVRAYIRTAAYLPLDSRVENMLAEQWLEGGAQGPTRFLQEMVQAHHRSIGDLAGRYAAVGAQMPVKIVWGAQDSWIPSDRAETLLAALNARELVLIPDAGHLVQYDQPSKLAAEVAVWLTMQN